MTVLPEPYDPRVADEDRRPMEAHLAFRRQFDLANTSAATLPQPRRRAVVATICYRRRHHAALAALPRLGNAVALFGVLGTPAAFETFFAGRFQATSIHGLRPFLILDDAFAEAGGSRPVMKALSRLPGR